MIKNVYHIKKGLIRGGWVSPEYKDMVLVGVPDSRFLTKDCYVAWKGQQMKIKVGDEPLFRNTFANKYGPGTYTLCYFEWKPARLEFGK